MLADPKLDDPTGSASDEALLAAYGQGDQTAARLLLGRLAPRLLAYASRVLGDRSEAEDVVQETMLRLWRAAPGWRADGAAKVGTWAYRVAANLAIDRLRKRRKSAPLDEIAEPRAPGTDVADRMHNTVRMAALRAALAELPDRQATAVTLRHLEGLSNPEIAEAMDIGIEAVESLTARGKRKLTELLGHRKKELGYDDE